MKKIGFIGLGDMGLAMAKNLLKAGFELAGYDLREERLQALTEAGGRAATSPADAVTDAEAAVVMVLNGEQALRVVNGDNGLRDVMRPGSGDDPPGRDRGR